MKAMQGDLAHFGFARLDVHAQEKHRLVRTAANDRAQNLGVLVIGSVDSMLLCEIESSDDADALGHFPMAAHDLGIASGFYQGRVEGFVQRADPHGIADAFGDRHQPYGLLLVEIRAVDAITQTLYGSELQDRAQVVEILELHEVERPHAPAYAEMHLQITFALETIQRIAHRRATHVQALCDLGLAEAIAR